MAKKNDNEKKAKELMRSSESLKKAAYDQEVFGKAQIKNKVKPGSSIFQGDVLPVGQERIDIAKKMRKEASQDSLKAVKLYPPITPKKKK